MEILFKGKIGILGRWGKESRGAEEKNPQGSSKQEYLDGTKFGVNHI
jgi:hypothetical protein